MRDWYIDCAPAFQAGEVSLILTFRFLILYPIFYIWLVLRYR